MTSSSSVKYFPGLFAFYTIFDIHESTTGCSMLKSKLLDCKVRDSFVKKGKTSANRDRAAIKKNFFRKLNKPLAVGSERSEACWSRLVRTNTSERLLQLQRGEKAI